MALSTTYYARAYATTSTGIIYGGIVSFTTSSTITCSIKSCCGRIWTNDNRVVSGGNAPFVEAGETHSTYSFETYSCGAPYGSDYVWDFGDGSSIVQGVNKYRTAHVFGNEGQFQVNLKIYYGGKLISSTSNTATIKTARFWMSMKFDGVYYITSNVGVASSIPYSNSGQRAYYYYPAANDPLEIIRYWLNPNVLKVGSYSIESIKNQITFEMQLRSSNVFQPDTGTITITRNDGVILEGTFSFKTKDDRITPRYKDVTEGSFRLPID